MGTSGDSLVQCTLCHLISHAFCFLVLLISRLEDEQRRPCPPIMGGPYRSSTQGKDVSSNPNSLQ